MTRRPIRRMAPELALKIAAGEVVERPASAVKELLDNAIDAGATRIEVEVREAGLKLIRVTDNGCGVPREELPLAFDSHATSKVETLDDLERLTTLGFRGEALPSIAAVSRVDVQTRMEQEPAGSRLRLEFGQTVDSGTAAVPGGFRISVADLFGNVPARRKFVRSLRAEAGQIASVVAHYVLAQPAIGFTLTIDGRLALQSAGSGHLGEALAAVYGADIVAEMCALSGRSSDAWIVEGLISTPRLTRPNRAAIHVAVNGRPIANRSLVFAFEEAYSGFLMTGRHPLAAIHLRLPADEVDANIHPAKAEVRFAREREVHALVHRSVAAALLESRLTEREPALQPTYDSVGPVEEPPLGLDFVDDRTQAAPPPGLLPALPGLRIVGQTGQTFILAEGPHGLYMIDQHAAHERVIFDRLDGELEDGLVAAQPLLAPATVELEPVQMAALDANLELLDGLGFALEPFGDTACLVRAVPALAGRGSPADLVREVLTELQSLPEPAAARERALAATACRAAVKAGQTLGLEEMRELVLQLERTPRPATCPHGRPTMIHLSHTQLEREFGRR